MTRDQAKEYVRVKVKQLKNDAIIDSFLNTELNMSQLKVQKELMSLQLKQFVKQKFGTGPYIAAPTDLQDVPNAIIDIKASTGARASVSTAFTGDNNDLKFTWNEPGTVGNLTDIITTTSSGSVTPVITVAFSSSGIVSNITIDIPTAYLASSLITLINADSIASLFITASNASGNDGTGTITTGVSTNYTTTGGTGTGWVPADEISIEDYNRIGDNSLIAPSATQPKFMMAGDLTGARLLQFLPRSITYAYIYYKYWVADLTADTDNLTIGRGFEELVLFDMIAKAFDMLKRQSDMATKITEYEKAKNEYTESYQTSIQAMVQEKTRTGSNDKDE